MAKYRTHTCGELTSKDRNKKVILSGWVNSRRDHGGIIFIDLRDRYGLMQIAFDPSVSKKSWQIADKVRNEYVVRIEGAVNLRPIDMINPKMSTGKIEVEAEKIEILSRSKTPPFEVNYEKKQKANEFLRLKYRFIDLRRQEMQKMLKKRDEFIRYIRGYFHKRDFIDVQTPILANSSPEGARDFLVPSRLYPGKFYALPQAPQQFKQLLMVGGVDKYFQIAPCFRDEDPRMDRAYGEFYQLDMEMSFVEQEDILNTVERLMLELTKEFSDKKIAGLEENGGLKRISWKTAMEKYGTDKPDLRFGMEIKSVTEIVRDCSFEVFSQAVKNRGVVHALRVEGGAGFTRKDIDNLTEIAREKGAKGLAYIIVKKKEKLQSPIVKFLGIELSLEIIREVKGKEGDIVFFVADEWKTACLALGAVRSECAVKLNLKDDKKAVWCWVVDFPMYSYSEIEEGKIDFDHNPFSMPQGGIEALEKKNPLDVLAYQYDLVLNGFEVGSGAIRNHDPEIMYKSFEIAGYKKEDVDNKFGAMIEAFKFGSPPHGGCAPGIDRIFMILNDCDSIRDVYAFPKDGKGKDLMSNSPSKVSERQMQELHMKFCDGVDV